MREYVLARSGHRCAYCAAQGVPLDVEHVIPRAQGGSNRPSNLVAACVPCNRKKGARPIKEFLRRRPEVLDRIRSQLKAPLKDAAAVNATRYAVGEATKAFGLPVSFWSGGRTKFNRTAQGYPKAHWIDAACVGEDGAAVKLDPQAVPLSIAATGRGRRQVARIVKYGFPREAAGRVKRVQGLQTGDLVRLDQPKGKYAGTHVGRLSGIRTSGRFDIKTTTGPKVTAPWNCFTLLQRGDGYARAA